MDNDYVVEVLLVEDNESDADLTLRSLKKYNLSNNIKWVKDGEEALDYLFGKNEYAERNIKDQPKVVLLDLKMPKIGGIEVLEQIRRNQETKKIPVVILTSSHEEKDIVQSYDLGVNSYIVKPVDFKKFMESIRDIGYYWLVMNKKPN
ncbi:MAG: response regulator [Balneolaceae bacterium]|nr:response regulator [Balneolaceae bacterium]